MSGTIRLPGAQIQPAVEVQLAGQLEEKPFVPKPKPLDS